MNRAPIRSATVLASLVALLAACAGAEDPADPCAGVACDDSNPCTDDSCEAGTCLHVDNAIACDDGDPCTVDACNMGICEGSPVSCGAYLCQAGVGCYTSCASSLHCAAGFYCNAGSVCAPLLANGETTCTADSDCASGHCDLSSSPGPETGRCCASGDCCDMDLDCGVAASCDLPSWRCVP